MTRNIEVEGREPQDVEEKQLSTKETESVKRTWWIQCSDTFGNYPGPHIDQYGEKFVIKNENYESVARGKMEGEIEHDLSAEEVIKSMLDKGYSKEKLMEMFKESSVLISALSSEIEK